MNSNEENAVKAWAAGLTRERIAAHRRAADEQMLAYWRSHTKEELFPVTCAVLNTRDLQNGLAMVDDRWTGLDHQTTPRGQVEAKVEAVLAICGTEPERAFLFRILRSLDWTTERADRVLRAEGW